MIMQSWIVTFFMLILAVQSAVVAAESNTAGDHDAVHHQSCETSFQTSHTEVEHQEQGHIHLCHHHHGEHTAKVLPAVVCLTLVAQKATSSTFSLFPYEDILSKSLYRPPISLF